jgi:hypothetical protein
MVENLDHERRVCRQSVVFDRLADVLDVERQMHVVTQQLRRLGEIDEALDSRAQQLLQPVLGFVLGGTAGMLAGEQQPGNDPVAVTQRRLG